MPFVTRALSGMALAGVTFALLGVAGWQLHTSISNVEKRRQPPVRERSYVVDVDIIEARAVAPVLTAYGQVEAGRTLEIRAPGAGQITEISPNMRNGRSVEAGELLFGIEPETFERRVIDARAGLTQAQLELSEASASKRHLQLEVDAANLQADVRRADLERKRSLHARKLITQPAFDEVRLAVSAAEQAIVAKEQEMIALESRIEKARAGIARAELTLRDAEKTLADASYRAPFAGRITEVALTLGRRVSQNEKLADLIDPTDLEVSFTVRNSEFGRLLDPDTPGKLKPLPLNVSLQLDTRSITVPGRLDRTAAVAANQSGRTLFARLESDTASALRPGDFVNVSVVEPQLSNVAVIPADAATIDGRVLLVGDDNRLSEREVDILRRQQESLIVRGLLDGSRLVRRRLPFLTAGMKVDPRVPADRGSENAATRTAALSPVASSDEIDLDPKRREALIAHVKSRTRLPESRRAQLLEELGKDKPSRRVIERLEQRMSQPGRRS